jgi:HAD superfamily hydrolase (TIGR01509 family)
MMTTRCILFDWGDTLMRDDPRSSGPMVSWPEVAVVPGALEVLPQLRLHYRLALATSADVSTEAEIWAALGRVGLEKLLDKVYCFRNTGHRKPSREFYDYILQDLGLQAADLVMVGDHFEADVLGANRVGIPAIWLNPRTDETRIGELYRTIHRLDELPLALEIFPQDRV